MQNQVMAVRINIHSDKTSTEQLDSICNLLTAYDVPFYLALPLQAEIDADEYLDLIMHYMVRDGARVEGAIMLVMNKYPKGYKCFEA